MTVQVVFDAAVLVEATAFAGATWLDWPAVPPVSGNTCQDAVGVIASSPVFDHDWALVSSRTIIQQTGDTLATEIGLHPRDVAGYLRAVAHLAAASGGAVLDDPTATVIGHGADLAAPLDLALAGRRLVVTANPALVKLGPLWGPQRQPIMHAKEFVNRVDAARRGRGG